MFSTVEARYVLRSILFGLSGVLVSLQASSSGSDLNKSEVIQALIAGGLAALSYAGIGAVSASVEPSIGRTLDDANVANNNVSGEG